MRLLQSLTRGLQVLDILRDAGAPMRLTAVAEALGVEKSNASHLLKTLVASGYARQDETRRYESLPQAGHPSEERSLSEVILCKELCRPALEALVAQTGECAHLAVLWATASGTSTRSTAPCLSRWITLLGRCRRCIARLWARRFWPLAPRACRKRWRVIPNTL